MRMNENAKVLRAIKSRQETRLASLVYCTKRAKRLTEKAKKETVEQSRVREGTRQSDGCTVGRISEKGN